MERGYIKVWRKLEDSGLLQMPNTLALFMYILMKATHKDRKIGTPTGAVELKRGQYMSGRKALARNLEQSEREIRTSLDRLANLEILTIKTTNKYSIYTIENYGIYQDSIDENDQQNANKRPTNDQQTTTKQELKNLRNISSSLRSEDIPKSTKKKATSYPDDFEPCNTALDKLSKAGISASVELSKFRDHCQANGKTFIDWKAAFRTWATNAVQWSKPKQSASGKLSAVERQIEMANQMFGGSQNGTGRIIDIQKD